MNARYLLLVLCVGLMLVGTASAAVLVVYPETNANGRAKETTDAIYATIRGDAGDAYDTAATLDTINAPTLVTTGVSGEFSELRRGILSFNTSALPDDCTISSVTLSLYGSIKVNSIGNTSVCITGGVMGDNSSISAGDYDGFLSTEFAPRVSYTDYNDAGWNNFTLNAAGKSAISTTSYTVFYVRDSWDVDNSFDGVWGASKATGFGWYSTRTANYPYLTIVYNLPTVTAAIGGASPLSGTGYVPLLVTWFDNSTSTYCTIDSWLWTFGDYDGSVSNDQNPQHLYTTSGCWPYWLTVGNTSYGVYDELNWAPGCYEVLENTDAPNADFTVTELCGDVGDTFYFIDFSTGGGLYAWNWSFGDGTYSELRNPTHQYAANGTYDVNLTVWGAYGTDSLLRSNLITIPCGAATPTPTPTPTTTTPTGNATVPVQAPAQPGRISPLGFVLLAGMNFGLLFYAFIDNENRNYFHIVALIAGMVVAFLCGTFLITGYITEDFVVTNLEASVNESVLSTYSVHQAQIIDAGFGYFFIFIGVIMLILGIMASVEAIREFSTEAGDFE